MNRALDLAHGLDVVLSAGDHLVELELDGALGDEELSEGLRVMGWADVVLDAASETEEAERKRGERPRDRALLGGWGSEELPPSDVEGVRRVRFVGRVGTPMRLANLAYLRWLHVRPLVLDAFADIRAEVGAVAMIPGAEYEVRFVSRLKGQPTRAAVADALRDLAKLDLERAVAMRANHRFPGRVGLTTIWLAIARYAGPEGFLTNEEPLWFEDVREIPLVHCAKCEGFGGRIYEHYVNGERGNGGWGGSCPTCTGKMTNPLCSYVRVNEGGNEEACTFRRQHGGPHSYVNIEP